MLFKITVNGKKELVDIKTIKQLMDITKGAKTDVVLNPMETIIKPNGFKKNLFQNSMPASGK